MLMCSLVIRSEYSRKKLTRNQYSAARQTEENKIHIDSPIKKSLTSLDLFQEDDELLISTESKEINVDNLDN